MKKMDKEILLGGVFGGIALVAAIAQMIIAGCTADAIAGGIKDVAGTMVAVLVFVIAIKQFLKDKPKKSFEDRMKGALDKWCDENSNMIVRSERFDKMEGDVVTQQGIGLKTQVRDFYLKQAVTEKSGLFLRMPVIREENYNKGGVELEFTLNKGTFFSDLKGVSDAELMPKYENLNILFCGLINSKFDGFATAGGKNKSIKVTIQQPVYSDEDINKVIELINTMYQAYLVSANMEE